MPSPVVHFEIAGRDGKRLEEFYGKLFDWKIRRTSPGGHNYGEIVLPDTTNYPEVTLTAGIRHEPTGVAEVVLYFQVEDLQASVELAKKLGASVRIAPMKTPEVYFALIRDPEGNPIGMTQRIHNGNGGL